MGDEGEVCAGRGTGRVAGEQGPKGAGCEGNRTRRRTVAQETVRSPRTMEGHSSGFCLKVGTFAFVIENCSSDTVNGRRAVWKGRGVRGEHVRGSP